MQPFFLNIFVTNTKDVVSAKVDEKVKPRGFGIFNKGAKMAAAALVSDDKVTAGLATALCEKVPKAIAAMGIDAKVERKWLQKNYVVLRVQVLELDKKVLLEKTKGKEFTEKFATMVECFEYFDISEAISTVDKKVEVKVQEALMTKLDEVLPAKLRENGIETIMTVCPREVQADYFFDVMGTL